MNRRIYFLDQKRGAVIAAMPDGSGATALVEGCVNPDGIIADPAGGYLYWTNMGARFDEADGSIERVRLDGSERTVIVPEGTTHTPKQIRIDSASRKLYWCDREGMRVMRANLDGSMVETLISTGDPTRDRGDATRWCVGIALDTERRKIYWTQKGPPSGGRGCIFRAPMDMHVTADAAAGNSVELLLDGLLEPVDLELSSDRRWLYWTDRGRVPGSASISRAAINPTDATLGKAQSVAEGMDQPIGLALDTDGKRLFATDLGGNLYIGDLDARTWTSLLAGAGKLTGICLL